MDNFEEWQNESWLPDDGLSKLVGLTMQFYFNDDSGGLLPCDPMCFIPSSKTWREIIDAVDKFYRQNEDEKIYSYNQWRLSHKATESKQVDPKRGRGKAGFVYLLKSGEYYKIGCTKQVGRRLAEISPCMPFETILICSIKTEDMQALEASLHQEFADKRVKGEWFQLSEQDIQAIKERGKEKRENLQNPFKEILKG